MAILGVWIFIVSVMTLDLPREVVKLGIYDAVPAGREALLEGTRQFINDNLGGSVELHPRTDFPSVVSTLTDTLFGHGSS